MGKTKGLNNAEFEVGTEVRIADRAFLEEFLEAGQYHNELEPEQLEYAGRMAKVKNVEFLSRRRRNLHARRHSRRLARGVPERAYKVLGPEEKTMAVDVIMPQMGESIFEGTITKWLKKPGDKIERDEPLFEISTDKVDAEIPAPSAGVLKEIKVTEGQTVPIQTIVAVIDAAGAAPRLPQRHLRQLRPQSRRRQSARQRPPRLRRLRQNRHLLRHRSAPERPGNGDKIRSSPLVRRIAREHDMDLSQVPGTGAGGRVSKSDILAAVEGGAQPAAAPADALQQQPAPSRRALRPCSKPPCLARRCTSAITKCSPCPSCGRGSPSTWCSRSAFRRTSIRSTKSTSPKSSRCAPR